MNVIFISPHFPPNYIAFSDALKNIGANVLGIASEPYENLPYQLKGALTDYYFVEDMEDYNQMFRAVAYFSHKYGKIDRIDSLNEYWLELEAKLRTDFNVYGVKNDTIQMIKRKSEMKKKFIEAGVQVARGKVIHDLNKARKFVEKVGFPVVAKPDNGVGALNTFKIEDDADLEEFFDAEYDNDYIFEEFIDGVIYSFDGLVNRDGELVFYTAHVYADGVMETVNNDKHISYRSLREIPKDLETAGRNVLKTFDLKERFFHLEFFRTRKEHKLVALEVNMRPPGGYTTDMFNYANDINIYQEWANVLVTNEFKSSYNRKYFVAYVGRKFKNNYVHTHDEIMNFCQEAVVFHGDMSGVFSVALGNYCYLVRSKDLDLLNDCITFIHKIR